MHLFLPEKLFYLRHKFVDFRPGRVVFLLLNSSKKYFQEGVVFLINHFFAQPGGIYTIDLLKK